MSKRIVTTAPDDDWVCPEVGAWSEEKLRLVSYYSTLFSSGMTGKWDKLVYLDLYAGAGCSRIRGTQKRILGSPLLALSVKDPFDKYIFCEEDVVKLDALQNRVRRIAPGANVAYVPGDCNERTSEILRAIPQGSINRRVLSLCFADPFDISLKFSTLEHFSKRYIDFLVLLAVWMDAGRAYNRYILEDAVKVDQFLGSPTWRERWKVAQQETVLFPKFLAKEFAKSMESLGYLPTPLHKMREVRSDEKNLRLYYIALFSRKEIALKLWDEVLKYSTDQTTFPWD